MQANSIEHEAFDLVIARLMDVEAQFAAREKANQKERASKVDENDDLFRLEEYFYYCIYLFLNSRNVYMIRNAYNIIYFLCLFTFSCYQLSYPLGICFLNYDNQIREIVKHNVTYYI